MGSSAGGAVVRFRQFLLLNPCLFLAGGLAIIQYHRSDLVSPDVHLDESLTAEIEGSIASLPEFSSDSCTFRLRVDRVFQRTLAVAYPLDIAVFLPLTESTRSILEERPLFIGERLKFRALLQRADHFAVPGVLDARKEFWRQGFLHRARLKSVLQLDRSASGIGWTWSIIVSRYVENFYAFCRNRLGDKPTSLIMSVFLGRKRALEPEDRELIRDLGILHLFVVSGFHVSLIVGCAHLLFRRWGSPGRIATVVCLWGYVLLAGAGIPTVRAGIMINLFYLYWLMGLQAQFSNCLGLSALAVLLLWPQSIGTASFQFSYLSLIAIGLYVLPRMSRSAAFAGVGRILWSVSVSTAPSARALSTRKLRFFLEEVLDPLPRWLSRVSILLIGKLLHYLLGILVCGLFVQAFLFPVTLFYSNRPVWTQSISNLLVVPVFALFLPTCLALFLSFWTPLSSVLGQVALVQSHLIQQGISLADQLASTSFLPQPRSWEVAAYWGLFLSISLLGRGSIRLAALSLPVLLTLVLKLNPPSNGLLTITMLDVGQGEAIEVQYPDGTVGLIDCAGRVPVGSSAYPHFYGERIVGRYLWDRRVKSLEYVLATHPDADHVQGLEFLRRAFPIGRLLRYQNHERYSGLLQQIAHAGNRYRIGEVEHIVLHPRPGLHTTNDNDSSLVVLVRFRQFSILFTGDIERRAELELVSQLTPVTVLKVPHHGARTSSSRELIEATRPRAAILSAGRRNPFGHPSPETMSRFRQIKIPVLSTAELGTLRVQTDGDCVTFSHYDMDIEDFRPIWELSPVVCSWMDAAKP